MPDKFKICYICTNQITKGIQIKMNILILGSGGREHAFAWKIAKSPLCDDLYIAPGNAGTHKIGTNININPNRKF